MSAPSSTFNYTSESNLSPAFPQSTTTTTSTTTTELNKDKEQRAAALYPSYADVASGSSNINTGKPIIFGPPVVHHERTAPLTLPSGSSSIMKEQQSKDFNFGGEKDTLWKEDSYMPSQTLLPDLSESQKEWEMKSAHIMQIKKQDEAARLAAQSGAAHLKGVPVMQAVNKVEHKCDSQCEEECIFIKGGADHPITEADVLAIRQHDMVAEQAASAGSKLQKAGFLRKAVHVSDAAAVVNATKTSTSTGPTMMQSIGNKARGVSSAIGDAVVSAKDTIVEGATTAKDKIAQGASTAKDKLATKKDQLMASKDSSSSDFDSSTTFDTTSTTTTTTESGMAPTRMQRVSAAATTVKDTLYDAGQRAGPVIQRAAVITGQVLQTVAQLATPVVHSLATAIADGTAADKKKEGNLQTTETMNTTTTTEQQQQSKPDIDNRDLSMKDIPQKDTFESSPSTSTTSTEGIHTEPEGFRTKPFDSSFQPTTAGEFMSKEVKSRPSSPALSNFQSPVQSDLSTTNNQPSTASLPSAVQPKVVVVLPDSALNYNVNDQQGSNFNKEGAPAANFSIDIQVKQKNNLNSNDQLRQQQQFNSGEAR